MMSYIAAAVVVLGVLCLVNLALMFALIRRVREHGERLASLPRFGPPPKLPAGTKAPEFTAVTTTGESRSLADLAGSRSLVGFFSSRCEPCREQLPQFAAFAKTIPGGPAQVLAVVTGEEKEATEFAGTLDGVAAVVIEPRHGPVATAFSARALPSFYLLDADRRIEANGVAMHMLADPVPA